MAGATNRRPQSPTIPVATEAAMTLHCETQRPIVSDNILAVVVYLLYCVGYFTGIWYSSASRFLLGGWCGR
jgi:hypothetical protein